MMNQTDTTRVDRVDEVEGAWDSYDEALGYDADHTDDRQYCRHGTFIGSWWGPDYMCGWCESGEEPPTPEEYEAMRLERLKGIEAEFDRITTSIANTMREQGWRWHSGIAQGFCDMAETPYFLPAQGLYIYSRIEEG